MHRLIQTIIQECEAGGQPTVTERSLLTEVFREDHNPEKGETPRSAMESWLSKTRGFFNIEWKRNYDDIGLVTITFRTVVMSSPIDVSHEGFYMPQKPEWNRRTRYRLIKLKKLGFRVVGQNRFGIPDVIPKPIHIGKIWQYNSETWEKYLSYAEGFIVAEKVCCDTQLNLQQNG